MQEIFLRWQKKDPFLQIICVSNPFFIYIFLGPFDHET